VEWGEVGVLNAMYFANGCLMTVTLDAL